MIKMAAPSKKHKERRMKRVIIFLCALFLCANTLTAGTIASKVRVYALPSDSLMFVVDYGNGGTLLTRKIHYEDLIEIIASSLASTYINADGDQLELDDELTGLSAVKVVATNPYEFVYLLPTSSLFSGQNSRWVYYDGHIDTTAQIVSTASQILNMFKTLDLWGEMTFKNESGDSAGYMLVHDTYGKLIISSMLHSATFKGYVPNGDHGPVWTIYNTSNANAGMEMHLGKESSSPASGDTLAVFYVDGKNDNGDTEAMIRTDYLQVTVADGAESARFVERVKRAGTWQTVREMNTSGIIEQSYKTRTVRTFIDTLGETSAAPFPSLCFADTADANNRLFLFDADSSRHGNFGAMMDLSGGSAGDAVNVLLNGYASGFTGLNKGAKVWASRTAGNITCTPDTNYLMVPVGHALSETEIWFDPDYNWSEK